MRFFCKYILKWGKNEEKFECSIFFEAQKYYFVFESRLFFFKWSYSQRCFDVENDNVVSTLSNVQFNVEKHNVVSKLFNVANFNFAVHNVVSTLIWRCATSRRRINLKTTLNRRWNVCWEACIRQTYFQLINCQHLWKCKIMIFLFNI